MTSDRVYIIEKLTNENRDLRELIGRISEAFAEAEGIFIGRYMTEEDARRIEEIEESLED